MGVCDEEAALLHDDDLLLGNDFLAFCGASLGTAVGLEGLEAFIESNLS